MSGEVVDFRHALTGAIRYWERRRIIYNVVLLAEVGVYAGWLGPGPYSMTDALLALFLLAVLANVAYCAAYLVDIPAQLSGYKSQWIKLRIALFLVGLAFSVVLTHYFSSSLFGPDI
jgi:hypothetical protein